MTWDLYDYIDRRGRNVIEAWIAGLEKPQIAKLKAKLRMLAQSGPALYPQTLAGTCNGNIKKLKVKGNVQLRPMLCEGPVDIEIEFTILIGARERDGNLEPADAVDQAITARQCVLDDSENRRTARKEL